MTSNVFADVSQFQPADADFFHGLKNSYNCKGAIVKLTYGNYPKYDNFNAGYQVYNAYKEFGIVSAYHYYMGSPSAEAEYFLKHVKSYGLDKTTMLVIDVEDSSLSGNIEHQTNIFLDKLWDAGYHNLGVYSMGSWFGSKINVAGLHHNPAIWVANITSRPKVKFDAWQYTFTAHVNGHDVDLSLDETGWFTTNKFGNNEPTYWHKGSLFEAKSTLNLYNDLKLKNKRLARFAKGSRFYGVPTKDGGSYRIKTKIGYVSGNTAYTHRIK